MTEDNKVGEDIPEETKIIIDNWEELKNIPVMDLFDKGWKPRVKTNVEGTRYITLRHQFKGEDGKWTNQEKSLGAYDPERWEVLLSMYPHPDIFPKKKREDEEKTTKSSPILKTMVARPKALPSSTHLELETLQWFQWVQTNAGYQGSLDDFLNDVVRSYFREHHGLELAVVIQKE